MIRTGIYGGSFNPIHRGHIALAKTFLHTMNLDEVWFVVSPQNPFKQNSDELLEDKKRFEMVKTAISGEEQLHATDYEFHLPRPSYTWLTLQALSKDYPQRDLILLIGADNWISFHRWDHHESIIKHYEIAIYPRRGYDINPNTLPSTVHLLDTPLYDISSTEIRERVRKGDEVTNLLPDNIKEKAINDYKRFLG